MRRVPAVLFIGIVLIGGVAAEEDFETRFLKAVDRVMPSVVTITSTYGVPVEQEDLAAEPTPGHGPSWPTTFSGVIVSEDGLVVTVANAVEGVLAVEVSLHDGTPYDGEVVGVDTAANVALVRIPARGLTPITFAPEDSIRPGRWIFCVGNSFGFSHTLAQGIVSGTDRIVQGTDDRIRSGLFQMTAPVNPGDAGGLVADMDGRMVGMVFSTYQRAPSFSNFRKLFDDLDRTIDMERTLEEVRELLENERGGGALGAEDLARILFRSFRQNARERAMRSFPLGPGIAPQGGALLGAEGVNFAIPAASVRFSLSSLKSGEAPRRGWLGVRALPVGPDLRAQLGLASGEGAVIADVVEGGPGAKGGLEPWDVVVRLNGQPVRGIVAFHRAVTETTAGGMIELVVLRRGRRLTLTVELGERQD